MSYKRLFFQFVSIFFFRFLPPGSYLDAYSLGHVTLAAIMNDTIINKDKYYDYFKWHNHYSIHATNDSADTDEICAFCAFLNSKKHSYTRSVYTRLSMFWLYYYNSNNIGRVF